MCAKEDVMHAKEKGSETARRWPWVAAAPLLSSARWWPWAAAILLFLFVASWFYFLHKKPPILEEPVVVDLEAACQGNRWIGLLNQESRENWGYRQAGEPIETLGAVGRAAAYLEDWEPLFTSRGTPVPPGLRRFLVYKGEEKDPRPRRAVIDENGKIYYDPAGSYSAFARVDRSEFEKSGRDYFERIDPDCRVVGPSAETLYPPIGSAQGDAFLDNAGRAPANLVPGAVRLEIIDSVRDSEAPDTEHCPSQTRLGNRECSLHGVVLAKLARRLLGQTTQIRSKRALIWTYEIQPAGSAPVDVELGVDQPPQSGGLFGYWSDLSKAIWRALDAWMLENDRPRLILNLSVGWESIYGEDVAPVRAALETAVCRGALVVAAAGNRRAGPEALEHPILPAAWEQERAPSVARCQALLGGPPSPSYASNTAYRPLLYAVGGIDRNGKALSTAKPRAMPRLAADGDHASQDIPSDQPGLSDRRATLTGTSVSTLLVSAAAAVEWNRDTDRSSFDVMETLWRSAGRPPAEAVIGFDRTVDFCLDPEDNCPPGTFSRRIFVGAPPLRQRRQPRIRTDLLPSVLTRHIELDRLANRLDCEPQILSYQGPSLPPGELCPQRRLFDIAAQPWLGPQPGPNHNPDCTLLESSPGTFILEFLPCFRYQGMPVRLDDFTLVAGNVAYRLPIDGFTLGDPTRRPRAGDPPAPCPLEDDPRRVQIVLKSAFFEGLYPLYVAATVNGDYAVITPLLRAPKEGI